MAVQAPYPSNAFCPLQEYQQLIQHHHQEWNPMSRNSLNAYQNYAVGIGGDGQQMVNGTVFSEPERELTCNASGSRKRIRENQMVIAPSQQLLSYHSQQHMQQPKIDDQDIAVINSSMTASTLPMERLINMDRLCASGPTSTSGISQVLDSYIYYQNLELEAFIRLQNKKMRAMVDESRKQHCGILLRMLDEQTLKRLEEKEKELHKVSKVHAELEEKVKQMSAENQMWISMAKKSEATVLSLRQSLEQLLHLNNQVIEGFGESNGLVDGAQSPQQQQPGKDWEETNLELKQRNSCKGCGGADLSVPVLPLPPSLPLQRL
ncbi:hypothetical protein CFOL_v3_20891 [Cephalotus follicularis]|uniref:BOI-related E3 ubiquitin-protein ligase 2 n=1 Tax=Cephalotus follicularis TaxID=3775 RepID=A0A1Q3CB08_CEPFO|nr:hypothetical protein CFOL_v3_20891 [Cephalotus follicularis]